MIEPPDDPAWRHYADTILHFDGGPRVDLRAPVTARDRAALAALGFALPFAVVTAYNPRGRAAAAEQNERRHAALLAGARLRDPGCRIVTGASPDGAHREPGVAVRLPIDAAAALACRWDQSAFFWFDGAAFTIHGALADTAPIPLPRRMVPR
jgi:hypothetical protein